MDEWKQDLRFAIRWGLRNPGFIIVAIITLALAIGANTAIFSVVNRLLLRPPPYPQSERLVRVWPGSLAQKGVFLALREQSQSLESIGAYTANTGFNMVAGGEAKYITGSAVSTDLLSVLRASAIRGRAFQPGEDEAGKDQLVMLSHRLWMREFGGSSDVIGRRILIDGREREVVGIMQPDFQFPSAETELWVPVQFNRSNPPSLWSVTTLNMIGRLRQGVTVQQADAELRSLVPQILTMFPWQMPDDWGSDARVLSLQEDTVGNYRSRLLAMLAAVLLVLLIACINVANLYLARATARQREIAIRSAMGASRGRIVRQLLTESVLIALVAGALGVFLAFQGLPILLSLFPAETPYIAQVSINWQVLAFTAGVAILTGIVFGLVPALQASKTDIHQTLKEEGRSSGMGRGRRKLASVLVVGEITVAMVLIITAGLLIKSLWRISQVDPGFRSEQILTARISQIESRCAKPPQCVAFYDGVLEKVRTLPGVEDAAIINDLPLGGKSTTIPMSIEGYVVNPGDAPPEGQLFVVTPGYIEMMGIPIMNGRGFADADRANPAGVAIVNQSLAQHFWPDQNPIGKQIKPFFPKQWWTVVGVVADVELQGITKDPGFQLYVPYGQFGTRGAMNLAVRTTGDPAMVAQNLRSVVASVDQNVPVSNIKGMEEVVSSSMSAPRSTMWLFITFALLALVLGVVGLYSLISYSVSWRTQEIGIRMALGAQPHDIAMLVLRQGFFLTMIGIGVGLVAAFAVTRILGSLLYQVSPTDPVTFVGVALLLVAVGLLASYMPSRRASQVDPTVAMRSEA